MHLTGMLPVVWFAESWIIANVEFLGLVPRNSTFPIRFLGTYWVMPKGFVELLASLAVG